MEHLIPSVTIPSQQSHASTMEVTMYYLQHAEDAIMMPWYVNCNLSSKLFLLPKGMEEEWKQQQCSFCIVSIDFCIVSIDTLTCCTSLSFQI